MPRRELRFQFRGLIEIKRTYKQARATHFVAGHDTIVVEKTYLESGIEMESRGNFVFASAANFVFN